MITIWVRLSSLFIAAVAGILVAKGFNFVACWGVLVVAALLQNWIFQRELKPIAKEVQDWIDAGERIE